MDRPCRFTWTMTRTSPSCVSDQRHWLLTEECCLRVSVSSLALQWLEVGGEGTEDHTQAALREQMGLRTEKQSHMYWVRCKPTGPALGVKIAVSDLSRPPHTVPGPAARAPVTQTGGTAPFPHPSCQLPVVLWGSLAPSAECREHQIKAELGCMEGARRHPAGAEEAGTDGAEVSPGCSGLPLSMPDPPAGTPEASSPLLISLAQLQEPFWGARGTGRSLQ